MAEPLLSAAHIDKSFLDNKVLDDVSMDLLPGEVHALLGENGAGKSTLIKILTGAYTHDSGTILLEGRPVHPRDTKHAQEMGVGTVYQEVNLLPNMTVAENLYIGRQPRRFGLVDSRKMERDAHQLLARYQLDIDVGAQLDTYSVAVQQIIAIARAVDISGKVLILDEPTASLDQHEVDVLFAILGRLKADGMAIVFITHFLDQVYEIADRVTVLRNGKRVGSHPIQDLDRMELVKMMLGQALEHDEAMRIGKARQAGELYASFRNYALSGKAAPFDLDLHKGEIVGVAGLLGSGRTEMARLLFGIDRPDSGELTVAGQKARLREPRDAVALGFAFAPEDRKIDGILGDLTVRENIMIALQARQGWTRPLSQKAQVEMADHFVKALDIRTTGIEQPVKFLSGGNQQKVVLARWLATNPRLLILDEPTRGIDVGAHAEIIRMINALCDQGMSLFVISSELDEIVAYSSRVLVLRDRAISGELRGAEITQGAIMEMIAAQHEVQPL
ncbi:sugar ABC transporter ATP-binding protein [Pelagibacterium montanilacus]|uniref:sugar ABC transporter ATP-binding protein n=1 Tax=Pelagibacterium montanilacus TaxID=2185280 RepID=UPI000F8DAA6C|nr:sugar ABC transporter ATP-binding protein [Pelagibacterium montanilacus]